MFDEEEEIGFLQKHRGLAVIGALLLIGGGVYGFVKFMSQPRSSGRAEQMTIVSLPPLPPPPPPPPPKPTPPPEQPPPEEAHPEQKMEEQQPVQEEKKEPPKAPDAPAPLGTSITGPGGGPDMGLGYGLGGGGGYGKGGGGGGSKYGWYASQVQSRVSDALRKNPRTRKASLSLTVRIWPDSTGRVTRARISGSTGDPSLDAAIQNDVLTGLQLTEAPPSDMPLPIVMRLSAQRPH